MTIFASQIVQKIWPSDPLQAAVLIEKSTHKNESISWLERHKGYESISDKMREKSETNGSFSPAKEYIKKPQKAFQLIYPSRNSFLYSFDDVVDEDDDTTTTTRSQKGVDDFIVWATRYTFCTTVYSPFYAK